MLQDGVTRALEAGNEQLLRDSGPKLYFSLKSLMSKSPALMPDDFISFKFVPQASPVESNGGCMFTCSVLLSIIYIYMYMYVYLKIISATVLCVKFEAENHMWINSSTGHIIL